MKNLSLDSEQHAVELGSSTPVSSGEDYRGPPLGQCLLPLLGTAKADGTAQRCRFHGTFSLLEGRKLTVTPS